MQKEAKMGSEKKATFRCDKCRGQQFSVNSNKKELACDICGRVWKRGDDISADETYAKLGGR